MDNYANYARGQVVVAPSPPMSGTSFTLVAGEGAVFPAPPFNATVYLGPAWPPAPTDAEVVRVTAGPPGDTFTITRSQETSANRSIQVGDRVYMDMTAKTVTDIRAMIPNASYRNLLNSSASHIAARVAGTYGMGQSQPLAISGTGILYPLNTIYIAGADYPTLDGTPAKLRLRAQLYTNDVAPTGNYTVGLHPITRPATSGAAGLLVFTIGTAVTGSTLAFNAPAVDASLNQTGSDFALPTDGHYTLGVVTTATVAASAHVHISAALQLRNF